MSEYDTYPVVADKVLLPDGSIVCISNATVVAPADADRAIVYDTMPMVAAKYILSDGSVINGLPITTAIEGVATPGYYIRVGTDGSLSYALQRPSAGLTSDVTVHDDGSNKITIGNVTARLFTTNDYTGPLNDFDVDGGQFTVPVNTTRYIVVNYNNGIPEMQLIADVNDINESDVIPVVTCYNDNSEIHYRTFEYWADGALNKHNQRLVFTRKFLRQSGFSISEAGTRYLTVSAGIAWYGIKKFITDIVASAADEYLYQWYHTGSPLEWTSVKETGSYNNTHFDDPTTGYKELTAGKYGVNWIYLMIADDENEIMYIMGTAQYDSVAAAQASTIPTAPDMISAHCILVGRVIFLKGASSGTIESAFDTSFTGTQLNDHNSLTGLQGGKGGEYYHLEHAQHDTLTDGSDASLLHIHGDLYYTEDEMDALLTGKADLVHTHDDRYYTEIELNAGQLDTRYYTETETDLLLTGKADLVHTHDDRYFTETEVTSLLSGKADTSHTQAKSTITDFVETDYVHVTGNETIAGNKTFIGNVQTNGQVIRPFGALTLANTGNNNIVIGDYRNLKVAGPTQNFTVTGFAGGTDGREIVIYNPLGVTMSFSNESSSSSVGNRILTLGTSSTNNQGCIALTYDGAASRWIVTGVQA